MGSSKRKHVTKNKKEERTMIRDIRPSKLGSLPSGSNSGKNLFSVPPEPNVVNGRRRKLVEIRNCITP